MTMSKEDLEQDRLTEVFGLDDVKDEAATPGPEATQDDTEKDPAEQPQEPDGSEEDKQEQEQQPQHQVPYAELKKEREKRKTAVEEARAESSREVSELRQLVESLQQKIQAPQQPAPPQNEQTQEPELPDPVTDPIGYHQAVQQSVLRQVISRDLDRSERGAVKQYGKDTVDKAYEWVKATGVADRLLNSDDFYGQAVDMYQQAQAYREIGDPSTYRQRIEEEARQKVLEELKQGGAPGSQLQAAAIPGTLADATQTGTQEQHETPQQMMDSMFAHGRKRR